MTLTVYLAGPITGLSWVGANDWREWFANQMPRNVAAINPLRMKSYLTSEQAIKDQYPNTLMSGAKAITARDRFDVMRCDVVLANVLGAKSVSIGTVMECAWADILRKPIVLVIDDPNPHRHAMLMDVVSWICPTLDDAVKVILGMYDAKDERRWMG